MPVPAVIAAAAENYRFNSDFLTRTVQDLSPDEWLSRPNDNSNHIAWIVGHVIWARKAVLSRLGSDWSQPWLSSFARGVKCNDVATFPSPETLMEGWREVSGVLATALDGASEEMVSQVSVQGPPRALTAKSAELSTSSPSTRPTTLARHRICAAGWATKA
jgi:hypothetical protein